jgi:hypothetical protein
MLEFGSGLCPMGPCVKGLLSSLMLLEMVEILRDRGSWEVFGAIEKDCGTHPCLFLCFVSIRHDGSSVAFPRAPAMMTASPPWSKTHGAN